MKKIVYFIIFLGAVSFSANAQTKSMDMKKKFSFLQRKQQIQNLKSQNQKFRVKINPYWQDVDAPHLYNSYIPQVTVPCFNTVWTHVGFDSTGDFTKWFLRSADGGKTWLFDTIAAPDGDVIGTVAPVDGKICYASMFNENTGLGGGIFKTGDGGTTWKQIEPGKLFGANSFPDFVYFFDAKNGLAVGDANGTDTSHLEIYTTWDAGKTWNRVPDQNIPPTISYAYSFSFQSYTVFENRIWFRAYDSEGNSYVYRSDDLGHHWQLFSFPGQYFDYAFSDKSNGLATYFDENGERIAISHDGGKTWADVNYSGSPNAFITAIPGTHSFVSSFPSTSYSNNYGATWKNIDSGVTDHSDIAFLNPFVGWTGRAETADASGGMYKWKLHFSLDNNVITADANASSDNAVAATKNNTTSLSTYPNPVSNSAIISFTLQQAQKVSLTIYDMNGRLIKTLAGAQMQQGSHQLTWNAKDEKGNAVGSGIYMLKLQAGNYIETKKISVIR